MVEAGPVAGEEPDDMCQGVPLSQFPGSSMVTKGLSFHSSLCKFIIEKKHEMLEMLMEAQQTLASPEIQMIPKTPAAKRQRKRICTSRDDNEDTNSSKQTRPTRSGASKRATRQNQESAELDQSSTGADTENENELGGPRRTRGTRTATTLASKRNKSEHMASPVLVISNITEPVDDEPACPDKKRQEGEFPEAPGSPVFNTQTVPTKQSPPTAAEAGRQPSSSFPLQKESPLTASPTEVAPLDNADSPPAPSAPDKKPTFGVLNVKQRASRYEELVRTSMGGSREGSPAERRHTPRGGQRPGSARATRSSSRPQTPASAGAQLPSVQAGPTSDQLQSEAGSVELDCQQTTTPHQPTPAAQAPDEPMEVQEAEAAEEVQPESYCESRRRSSTRHSSASRRSSTARRVSGLKLSLSKRRSSSMRRKSELLRAGKQSTYISEIKARLFNASQTEKTPDPHLRSTRSKLRLNKANRVDSPASALRGTTPRCGTPATPCRAPPACASPTAQPVMVCRVRDSNQCDIRSSGDDQGSTPPRRTTRSKMRQPQPPPRLPFASDSDQDGTDSPTVPYRPVMQSSAMAPVRSTRSKVRRLQEEDDSGSPCPPAKRTKADKAEALKHIMTGIESKPRDLSPQRKWGTDSIRDRKMFTPSHDHSMPMHSSSFLNHIKKNQPQLSNTTITSFIQRNTPTKKPNTKDVLEQKRQQLMAKERTEQDRIQRHKENRQKRAEEQKRKREERQLLVSQRREEQFKEKELKKDQVKKSEMKPVTKVLEEKMKEEQEKQKAREKKMAEVEQRRKQEEDIRQRRAIELEQERQRQASEAVRRREQEEQTRMARLAEQRRQQEERATEAERERLREQQRLREKEEQLRREEQQRQREREDRERREKAERERQELDRQKEREQQKQMELEKMREMERQRVREEKQMQEQSRLAAEEERRIQKMIEKHNLSLQQQQMKAQQPPRPVAQPTQVAPPQRAAAPAPAKLPASLNTTVTKEPTNLNNTYDASNTSSTQEESQSYDMTPTRKVYKTKQTEENYNINDMKSDDSTDDEEAPRKTVPSWALGHILRAQLIEQHYRPPDLDIIFGPIELPNLSLMFKKKKAKFFKRTSSAVWTTPLYLPSGKPMI